MENDDKPSYIRIYFVVIATNLLHLSTGAVMYWSSPAMTKLNLTSTERSLISSLYTIGSAPGPFIISLCLNTIGRKGMFYVICTTFGISWIILLISKSVSSMYMARLIAGIGVGGAFSGIPIYISEVALTEIRGPLGASSYFFMSIGGIWMYTIGLFVDYSILEIYGLFLTLLFIVVFYFVPESPYYFIKIHKKKEALESLQMLRGYRYLETVETELKEIEATVNNEANSVNFFQAVRTPTALRAIGIGVVLMAVHQFVGMNPLLANAEDIFGSAELNFPLSYIAVVFVVASLVTVLPIFLLNRLMTMKTAVILSGFATAFFLILLGLYFYILNLGVDVSDYSYLSAVAVFLAMASSSMGAVPLIWPLLAELLPSAVKGIGVGICGCFNALINFACIAMFSIMSNNYGYSTTFFGFAALLTISTFLTCFILPETAGKTFREIQTLL